VKLCFSQKRKTLVNNLRSLAKPAAIREILASLNLRPDSRAEQLSLSQFVALQARLFQARIPRHETISHSISKADRRIREHFRFLVSPLLPGGPDSRS